MDYNINKQKETIIKYKFPSIRCIYIPNTIFFKDYYEKKYPYLLNNKEVIKQPDFFESCNFESIDILKDAYSDKVH